jgi:hypothetical protein
VRCDHRWERKVIASLGPHRVAFHCSLCGELKPSQPEPGTFERADYFEVPEEVNVYSWSHDPVPGRTPATQVHVHFGKPPGPVFVVRFKSRPGLQRVLQVLQEHLDDVWPEGI